jgi:lipopolysaccharide/colanic/teichoic acid biosynthesis glycosyltransferase
MVPNADEIKAQYAHLNELQWPDFKITNDPRITPLGRILRKTSLDELPQLFNILRGEMSLVGPRPTSFGAETYELWHTQRLDVMPGMTGLWQVEGRAKLEFDDRLRLDIAYIERATFWFDIYILFRTFKAVFRQKGAH